MSTKDPPKVLATLIGAARDGTFVHTPSTGERVCDMVDMLIPDDALRIASVARNGRPCGFTDVLVPNSLYLIHVRDRMPIASKPLDEYSLQLFRFAGHPHYLTLMVGRVRRCSHQGCTRPEIQAHTRHFGCIPCNFDLCTTCVRLEVPDALVVPLQEHPSISPHVFRITPEGPTGSYTGTREVTEEEKKAASQAVALRSSAALLLAVAGRSTEEVTRALVAQLATEFVGILTKGEIEKAMEDAVNATAEMLQGPRQRKVPRTGDERTAPDAAS